MKQVSSRWGTKTIVVVLLSSLFTSCGASSSEEVILRDAAKDHSSLIGLNETGIPILATPDGGMVWKPIFRRGDTIRAGRSRLLIDGRDIALPQLPGEPGSNLSPYSGEAWGDYIVLSYCHKANPGINTTPWTLAAWNRKTGSTAILDSREDGPEPAISVDHGVVTYSATADKDGLSKTMNIYRVDVDGSTPPRVIEHDSGAVQMSWPYAFALKRKLESRSSGRYVFNLKRIDLQSDEKLILPQPNAGRGAFAVSGQHVLNATESGDVVVADLNGRIEVSGHVPDNFHFGGAGPVENGFFFIGDDGKSLHDTYSAILVLQHGKWNFVRLARMSWADKFEQSTIHVVGNGKFVYWSDGRTAKSSRQYPDNVADFTDIWHSATIEQLIIGSKYVSTLPPMVAPSSSLVDQKST